VDQFSGESKPVTLALGGEEVTSFTPEFSPHILIL
jgi:hypothetical protein